MVCAVVTVSYTLFGKIVFPETGSTPSLSQTESHFTRSAALEITPPAPPMSDASCSSNQNGTRLPSLCHDCVSFPEAAATEGRYVLEDMPSGLKMRSETNSAYVLLA